MFDNFNKNEITMQNCPCCNGESKLLKNVDNYDYFICNKCKTIFIDNAIIDKIDRDSDFILREYNKYYWQDELSSSRERSFGVALARMAEAIYYSRVPIRKFLDIGTGAGYFLDAISRYIPENKHIFYGVEKFPPDESLRTKSPNYIVGECGDLDFHIDGGICIEVIEHLTPNMLKKMLLQLSKISNKGAFYIFNTGMPGYVLNEDINYLDPTKRGHIVSYSTDAIRAVVNDMNFKVYDIPGKTWAFALEYDYEDQNINIQDRIWSALPENLKILNDKDMGSVLKVLGLETARAYI